jgi:2-desacetyl-2-hydroxyethyl bacteriochlorophyllide A dehydrogenase
MTTTPLTMQALQMVGLDELVMTELPVPTPGPRELLIRTLAVTICTSDLHDLARNPFNIKLPRVLGHEPAGIVVACGNEVREFASGMRVAVHPVVPCGECAECRKGFSHLCTRMGHLGYDRDGAYAEYFLQRADRVRRLPESVPATVGVLLEPVAVCLQAISRAGDVRGREVLIVGDGPFGNIIARLAARAGADRVVVVGREPFRLRKIRDAEAVMSPPIGCMDVAVLAVTAPEAVATCLQALRPRGRLVVFSALPGPMTLDLTSLHIREMEIVGSCNDEERIDEALLCLEDPVLALHELITHALPFSQWAEAFALARHGHDRALKVALTFPEPA